MAKQRMKFTFPPDLVTQPVIYNMGKEFHVVTNIRRANVTRDRGWMILEISGNEGEIERAVQWAKDQGVRVDSIEGEAS
ncbi:MAG TPA: NIL domain-containing protein [Chloroflexota bacterium]|nr:NIL domain-containing protein [Chloroflexota bacterium]